MAKMYVCDSCGEPMRDPHKVKMREFYVGYVYEYGTAFPVDASRKTKVDLCEECYENLRYIARTKGGAGRPYGYWIGVEADGYADGVPVYNLWQCSECGEEVDGEDVPETHPFCHGCGADMRARTEE